MVTRRRHLRSLRIAEKKDKLEHQQKQEIRPNLCCVYSLAYLSITACKPVLYTSKARTCIIHHVFTGTLCREGSGRKEKNHGAGRKLVFGDNTGDM